MALFGDKTRKTVRVKLHGLHETRARLRRLGDRAIPAAKAALREEAERIMTASKLQVPVDTGNLRASGHVSPPTSRFGNVSIAMGYGGPAAPYALRQHETLSYRHTVGKAKYLTDPANAAEVGMDKRLSHTLDVDWIRPATR